MIVELCTHRLLVLVRTGFDGRDHVARNCVLLSSERHGQPSFVSVVVDNQHALAIAINEASDINQALVLVRDSDSVHIPKSPMPPLHSVAVMGQSARVRESSETQGDRRLIALTALS